MARNPAFSRRILVVFVSLFQAVVVLANGRNFSPFYFTEEPTDVTVQKGQPAILNCSAHGVPSPTIEWKKDQLFLNLNGDTRRTILPSGSLRINNVTHSRNDRPDEGLYECVATVDNLGTIVSRTAKLQVADLGRFEEEPQSTSVFIGDTAIFRCSVEAVPPAVIRWQKNKQSLDTADHVNDRYLELPSGTLEIRDITSNDEAGYRCRASNVEGARRSEDERLSILFGTPRSRAPEFVSRPQNTEVKEGEDVILECAANGTPKPSMSWWKDGRSIIASQNSEDHYSIYGGANLRIKGATESDTGTYTCSAINAIGNEDTRAELLVQVPPRFEKQPESLHSEVNKDIVFECKVYGVPFPTIEWIKNGDIITPSEYFQIVQGTNLKILGLVKSDEGLYQCMAKNKVGNIQTSAQLIIVDRDETLPTLPVLIRSTTSQSPTAMVGTDPSPSNVMVPGVPRDVLPLTVSTRFVSLSWREPRLSNGYIVAYSVYFRRQGSPRERVVNTTGVESVTVRDLIPSTRYEFRVKAYNEHGPGESSEVIYVDTQPEVQVPGPVQNLRAMAVSTTAIKIFWNPPQHRNGVIQFYKIYYAETARMNSEVDIDVSALKYTKSGLKMYTDYTIRVVAYNENGPGVSSDEVIVRTYSDQPSAPPANVTIVAQSSKSINIQWDPPPLEERNGEIISYKLRWKEIGSRRGSTITLEGSIRSFTVAELERDTDYEFRLSAWTINGTSPSTDWLRGRTLENDLDESILPPAPTSLKVRAMARSILVEWTPPPVESNVFVRGYKIAYGIGVPDQYSHDITDPSRRHFTLKNLSPASTYVIMLRAFNNRGLGVPIYETVATRPESTPEADNRIWPPVGIKAVVLTANAVKVKWSDSSLHKQRITDNRYYTIMYKTNYPAGAKAKFINTTTLEYTIDELKPSTMYEFAVKMSKGKKSSPWSLSVFNKTFEALPGSPPKTLTIVPYEDNPTAINLNWQPPKLPNGAINGYVIYYTTDSNQLDRDWVIEPVAGPQLTGFIDDLTADTTYYFKIQARNKEGLGPMSEVVEYRTPKEDPTTSAQSNEGEGLAPNILWIIIACVVGVTLIAIVAVSVFVCKRRADDNMAKKRKQGGGAYKPPPKGGKKAGLKDQPPDLWINHDQMELKQMEKMPMPEPMTQISMSEDVKGMDDPPPPMETLQKRNSFVGDDDLDLTATDRNRSLERKRKPIMIPVDPQPPPPRETIATATALPNGSVSPPMRPTYPKTQYNTPSVVASSGSTRNPNYDQPEFRVRTQFNYPMTRSKSLERPGFMTMSSSGYQSDNTTVSSDDGTKTLPPSMAGARPSGHPLKSFSVPGPPPHYSSISGNPQQKHPGKPGMISSPYKKPTVIVGGNKNRMHPLPVNTPRAPDVAVRGKADDSADNNSESKSFSTEDLNAEMANLEGLMKDLNAITATELEC